MESGVIPVSSLPEHLEEWSFHFKWRVGRQWQEQVLEVQQEFSVESELGMHVR